MVVFVDVATQKCCNSDDFSWEKCPHVLAIPEKEREEKEKKKHIETGQPSTNTSTKAIIQAMPQFI